MLLFLASIIEQLDLSQEHLRKKRPHDARFALMLTDNALELVLHQIAQEVNRDLDLLSKREEYAYPKQLAAAMGRQFDDKVKLAKLEGRLSKELAPTLEILHEHRNQLYHVGIQYEPIIQDLAELYFYLACDFISSYRPRSMSWSGDMRIPKRASKYFKKSSFYLRAQDEFKTACLSLKEKVELNGELFAGSLADHLDRIICDQDMYLDIVSKGPYNEGSVSRDQAIIDSQAWKLTFTEEGRKFAKQNGSNATTVLEAVQWIGANYKFRERKDPVPSWRKQANLLRTERNVHRALNKYYSFMNATQAIRELLLESAGAVEAEIDRMVDAMRER